jgi:hypothetical protein
MGDNLGPNGLSRGSRVARESPRIHAASLSARSTPEISQQNFNTERQATAPCRNCRGSSGVLNAQGNTGGLLRFARPPRSRRMRAEAPSRQHRARRTTDDRERRPTAQLHCTGRAGSASVATSDTTQYQVSHQLRAIRQNGTHLFLPPLRIRP